MVQDNRAEGVAVQEASSALKLGVPLMETPQSVSVIPALQLEVQGVNRYSEAFRYTPGIQAEPFGQEIRRTWLRLRGFDSSQDALFKDGLKLANNNFIAAYSLEPYGAERLEVPRGPASVLYGQGSPGGLVNYITKRPQFTPFHEAIFQAGSFERYQGQFDTTGPLNKKGTLAYRLTGLFRDSETQIDYVDDNRIYVAPALTWRPSDDTSITLLAHYQRDRTQFGSFLPIQGTLFDNPNGKIPSDRFTGEPDVDHYERDEFSIGYLFEHRFNAMFQLRQNLRYHHQELDDITIYTTGLQADLRTISRSRFDHDARTQGLTVDTQIVADFKTGPVKHIALAGVDYQYLHTSSIQADGPVSDLDVYNPVYGRPVPAGAVYLDQDSALHQIGLYLQDHLNLTEQLILSLGGRYDFASSKIDDNLTGMTSEQDDTAFTGRVGVLYTFAFGVSPYASYTTSFLPILGTDASGNPFQPETASQWEVGVKYQPKGWHTIFTLAFFDLTREDFVTSAPDFTQVQNGKGKSRGVEFEARSGFDNGLSLIAAYTYLDTELTESAFPGEVGEPLGHAPTHQASLWGDYLFKDGPLKNLRLGGGVRYIGSQYGDLVQRNNSEIKVPDVGLFDLAAHYKWGRFKSALTVHNIADKEYISGTNGTFAYEGLRRTIAMSIGYEF